MIYCVITVKLVVLFQRSFVSLKKATYCLLILQASYFLAVFYSNNNIVKLNHLGIFKQQEVLISFLNMLLIKLEFC